MVVSLKLLILFHKSFRIVFRKSFLKFKSLVFLRCLPICLFGYQVTL